MNQPTLSTGHFMSYCMNDVNAAVSKHTVRQFRTPVSFRRDWAVGSFYLVSRPGEVKDPTQGVNV